MPDHVKDYIKILDEKSQRLHHMVQDVFAVSKAASGELPMQMEELDFGKLLQQTLWSPLAKRSEKSLSLSSSCREVFLTLAKAKWPSTRRATYTRDPCKE